MSKSESIKRALPADMNDLEAWSALAFDGIDDYIEELAERSAELSHSAYKELLPQVAQDLEIGVMANVLADAATDPADKLRRLQEPLYNIELWPGWSSAARTTDFLEIMWSINNVAESLPANPDEISRILASVLDDPEVWSFPLAPTAIVAAHQLQEADVRLILGTFVDAWNLASETPSFRGSSLIDTANAGIERAAPLLAVTVLNPAAPMDLVDTVLRICTFSDDEELKLAFWEYISACLTEERMYGGYWDPVEVWQLGFFGNGLADDAPPMDSRHILHVLEHFRQHQDTLDLVTPYDEPLASQVMTLYASREDVDLMALADIARTNPWVDALQAAIANPKTPDDAKAAGARRIS